MPTVTGLFVYPVKSGRGVVKSRVQIAATGFEWGRHWMVVDAKGRFITQRTHPQLARVVPEITESSMNLSAPGLPVLQLPLEPVGAEVPVQVWDYHGMALDQGKEAQDWVSQAIGESVRLVRVAPSMPRVASVQYAGPTRAPL